MIVRKVTDTSACADQRSNSRFSQFASAESLCDSQFFSQILKDCHQDEFFGVCSRSDSRMLGKDAVSGARDWEREYCRANASTSASAWALIFCCQPSMRILSNLK